MFNTPMPTGKGGWTPNNWRGRTLVWLDAADRGTIEIGTGVKNWFDKSGNANHYTQATGANQPAYSLTSFNSLYPGVTPNGTSQYLQTAANIPTVAQPICFAMALYNYTGGTSNADFHREDSGSAGPASYRNAGGATWTMHAGNFFDTGSAYDSGAALRLDYFSGANSWISSTGTVTTGDAGTNGITGGVPYNLFTGFGHSGTFVACTLGEYLIIPGTLSAQERELLEGYLAWKWGIQNKLPASHRYRTRKP